MKAYGPARIFTGDPMHRTTATTRTLRLAAALLLACTGVPATAQDTASPLPAGDSETSTVQRVQQAMLDADVPALAGLYRSPDPIAHVWAAMALERVHFKLDAAAADAKVCEDALFASRPAIALLCGQFQSGNLRLAGRHQEARAWEAALIERYRGRGLDRQLAGMQAYLDRSADLPAPVVQPPAADVVLPFKKPPRQDVPMQPVVAAQANGHDTDLLLDTGASVLTLGEDEARRFGVRMLGGEGHARGLLSKGVPVRHGLLETLELGPLTLRDLPANVLPGSHRPLLGLDLLAPLGALRFSQAALRIYGTGSTPPACTDPMLLGSDLWGQSLRLHPQLPIDGQLRNVVLDTGDYMYLTGSQAALDEVTTLRRGKLGVGDLGGRHPFANVRAAKVEVTIAGQPIRMYFPVYADADIRWPILLGFGALRDMDFLVDFRQRHLCFLLHPGLH
jgi:hypothetical protein